MAAAFVPHSWMVIDETACILNVISDNREDFGVGSSSLSLALSGHDCRGFKCNCELTFHC